MKLDVWWEKYLSKVKFVTSSRQIIVNWEMRALILDKVYIPKGSGTEQIWKILILAM